MMANVTKTYNILLRFGILAGAYGYLVWKLLIKPETALSFSHLTRLFSLPNLLPGLLAVVILMALNWGIETWKWKSLISKAESVSFKTALTAVLTGVTVSIFTPNRMGEYIGRVFLLRSRSPVQGILITLIGSLSQIVVYFISGVAGITVFFFTHILPIHPDLNFLSWIILPGAILSISLTVFLFLNVSLLTKLGRKIIPRKWHRTKAYLSVFRLYSSLVLLTILLLSLFRYMVFTLQYLFLLWIFCLQISLTQALMATSVIFFLLVIIPSVALAEVGIRNTVALTVLGMILNPGLRNDPLVHLSIVSTATTLWVINVGIPALAGSFFVFRLKFFRRNNGN